MVDFQFIGVGQHWANWRWRTCHIHRSHNPLHHPVSSLFYIQYQYHYPAPETGFSSYITSLTRSPSQTGFLASTSILQLYPVWSCDSPVRRGFPSTLMSSLIEETAFTRTVINPIGWTGTKYLFFGLNNSHILYNALLYIYFVFKPFKYSTGTGNKLLIILL